MRKFISGLYFVKEAISRLLDKDSLIVIAPGLGLHTILLGFLQAYLFQSIYDTSSDTDTSCKSSDVSSPRSIGAQKKILFTTDSSRSGFGVKRPSTITFTPELNCVPRPTKIVLILNTSNDEAEIIRDRALLLGWKTNMDILNEGDDYGEKIKKRKTIGSEVPENEDGLSSPREYYSKENLSKISQQLFPFYIITSSTISQQDKRQNLYSKGGIFVIPARTVVTDFLSGRLPPEIVDGIIVNHAHNASSAWNVAFALRLFRQKNKAGFIKGLCDRPEALCRASSQLDRIMKILTLQYVHLFPRFHASVESDLRTESQPTTSEIVVKLTPCMKDIQMCLVGLIKKGYINIKRLGQVDFSQLTLEEFCFKKSLEAQIQAQLDPLWHSLSPSYKKLISDISTFRKLLLYLTQMDSIQFFTYLESLRTSETLDNRWLLTAEWAVLIKRTRERLFRIERCFEENQTLNPNLGIHSDIPGRLHAKLQIPPKWSAVATCVSEAGKHLTKQSMTRLIHTETLHSKTWGREDNMDDTSTQSPEFRILIITHDEATVDRLEKVLLYGQSATAEGLLRLFIMSEGARRRTYLGGKSGRCTDKPESFCSPTMSLQMLENVLLMKESDILWNDNCLFERQQQWSSVSTPEKFNEYLAKALEEAQLPVKPKVTIISKPNLPGLLELRLRQLLPHSIFLVYPDVTVVRSIEVYCAEQFWNIQCPTGNAIEKPSNNLINTRLNIKLEEEEEEEETEQNNVEAYSDGTQTTKLFSNNVFCGPDIEVKVFVFEGTSEQQQFLYSLQSEKEAWKSLIQQRKFLVVPINESFIVDNETFLDLVTEPRKVSTRKSGGLIEKRRIGTNDSIIVVDMREFGSSLPFQIHCRNIKIIPVTLMVGDYILSRDVCIERKSIADFVSSISSGRLFDQISEMTRYYSDPALLIEFKDKQNFSFSSREWTNATDNNSTSLRSDILSRLCLLIVTFPQIRILWSSSTSFTANLFQLLKIGRAEPDPFRASLLGSAGTPLEPDSKSDSNPSNDRCVGGRTEDVLRKLPGVTNKNLPALVRNLETVGQLTTKTHDDLKSIIGESYSRELIDFLNAEWLT